MEVSCQIEAHCAGLLARQAKRRHCAVAGLASLYLREKTLQEEYPGIGFRDAIGGREAFAPGFRVAVWEVVDAHREAQSPSRTADHFGMPEDLVKHLMAYAQAFPEEIASQRRAEVDGKK